MKWTRHLGLVALVSLALAAWVDTSAWAQSQITRILNLFVTGSLRVGDVTTAHRRVHRMQHDFNFGVTGVGGGAGAAGCQTVDLDAGSQQPYGARPGDTCVVALPVLAAAGGGDGAASPPARSTYDCWVSASGRVTLRHCSSASAGENPPDAGYVITIAGP